MGEYSGERTDDHGDAARWIGRRVGTEVFHARQAVFSAFERLLAHGVEWSQDPDLYDGVPGAVDAAVSTPLRVVIVDDYEPLRQLLHAYLTGDGHRVVGQAENGRKALDLVARTPCDVVVLDLGIPGLDGAQSTRELLARPHAPLVIGLAVNDDRQARRRMMDAGASACFAKTSIGDLRAYIHAVADGARRNT